jgi:hypothetical protein
MRVDPLRYFRRHPFSIMALCFILGDGCYLGYALYAQQGMSVIRLLGALSAFCGHSVMLAYGDDQVRQAAGEKGATGAFILALRGGAQKLLKPVLGARKIAKPVFWGFGLLAMNGVALLADAVTQTAHLPAAMGSQGALGIFIVGCGTFAAADLVKRQRMADILTKAAPTILLGADVSGILLAVATWNPFILAGLVLFGAAKFAAFCARLDKTAYL